MARVYWKFLFQAPRGHKYFRDMVSGRIAVADDSGTTPDTTEDGILWLDNSRDIVAGEDAGRFYATVPVLVARSDEKGCVVGASLHETLLIMQHLGRPLHIAGMKSHTLRLVSTDPVCPWCGVSTPRDEWDGNCSKCGGEAAEHPAYGC